MAVLAACANGNLTDAATWALTDSTAYLNSETANTALTTSYVASSTFTPGAITIDGIMVKIASTAASETGTMSVELYNSTDVASVAGTEVTINVSDLKESISTAVGTTNLDGGWVLLKFASVLLVAGKAYAVRAKTSSASQVNLYRDGTSNNWSRVLRTTTTQAPVAGDDMIITAEYTAAATRTTRTVTMNETAATDYGNNTTTAVTPALAICRGGTLTYGTTAATNYVLRLSGYLVTYRGGTLNIGTTGTPIPRDSTAVLEFDSSADASMGIKTRFGSVVTMQGLSRTSGKNIVACKLNTDEAVNSTSLGVDTDTGWLDNDDIVLPSTTQTNTQMETGALNGNAGASSLTVDGFAGAGGGLANAHSGTSPTQCEVGLLTRNVKVRSVSSTNMCDITFGQGAIDIDWTEFRYCNGNGSATSQLYIGMSGTSPDTFNMAYSSVWGGEDGAIQHILWSGSNPTVVIDNCVFHSASGVGACVDIGSQSTALTFTNNLVVGGTVGLQTPCVGTFTGNTFSSGSSFGVNPIRVSAVGATSTFVWNTNTIHSYASGGMVFANNGSVPNSPTFGSTTIYRCGSMGLQTGATGVTTPVIFDSFTVFGCVTSSVRISNVWSSPFTFRNLVSNGDTTFATTSGIDHSSGGGSVTQIILENCSFSQVAGIKTAHTQDISWDAAFYCQMRAENCLWGSTKLANQTTMVPGSYLRITRPGQTGRAHLAYYPYGTVALDETTFKAAAPSEKMTPNNASNNIYSGSKLVPAADTTTPTVNVWVQKDGSFNGTAELVYLRNVSMDITTETVLDTLAAGASTWEQLTGVLPAAPDDGVFEVAVRCRGTAGSIYVDDWSMSA